MRREAIPQGERRPFYLYADEFQTFAGVAEGTWRELLSRGRRYGLALTLAHQFPSQLPAGLQDEIFGNVASLVAFGLSAKDAMAVRRELLELHVSGGRIPDEEIRAVSHDALITLRPGQALARLGSGALALPVRTLEPIAELPAWKGRKIREVSWRTYGAPPAGESCPPRPDEGAKRGPKVAEDFLE
jgi:hypothetical protein